MNKLTGLFLRYLSILILGLNNLAVFYFVLGPLTIYVTYLVLNIFVDPTLYGNLIFVGRLRIEIIDACVAGSAYYLLFFLAMSIPNVKPKLRFKLITYSFITFFVANIIRIIILYSLESTPVFVFAHMFFWYFISTILVVVIWIYLIRKYRIKEIPVYSDFKLLSSLKKTKNTKRGKKNKKSSKNNAKRNR